MSVLRRRFRTPHELSLRLLTSVDSAQCGMEGLPSLDEDKKPSRAGDSYASKKAVAQRMADLALLTSNASQLRYIIRYTRDSPTFGVAVFLIVLSLGLQVAVGIFLIFKMRKTNTPEEKDRNNTYVVAGVFLITIVNVLMGAFGFEDEIKSEPTEAPLADRFSIDFENFTTKP